MPGPITDGRRCSTSAGVERGSVLVKVPGSNRRGSVLVKVPGSNYALEPVPKTASRILKIAATGPGPKVWKFRDRDSGAPA
jgi:hypothetical protein